MTVNPRLESTVQARKNRVSKRMMFTSGVCYDPPIIVVLRMNIRIRFIISNEKEGTKHGWKV
jgi:hypothetical protein